MKIFKQAWKAFVLLLFFMLLLNSGCTYDYQGGPAHLEPLPNGIGFEIKFALCPEKTLDEHGNLNQWTKELFNNALPWSAPLDLTGSDVNRDVIQMFVDTRNLDLWKAGWLNRIRHHVAGGSQTGDVQLTFRKRINITNGTRMTEDQVLAAIAQAKKEGTLVWAALPNGRGMTDNVEIDWSYDSATLTLSRSINDVKFNITYPSGNDIPHGIIPRYNLDGAKWLIKEFFLYGSMDDFNLTNPRTDDVEAWYLDKVENGVLYGPAYIRRHRTRGTISAADSERLFGVPKIQRIDFDIEVLPVGDAYIVELSTSEGIFYTPGNSGYASFEHISRVRDWMHDFCLEHDILLPQNSFKTTMILENMRQ